MLEMKQSAENGAGAVQIDSSDAFRYFFDDFALII